MKTANLKSRTQSPFWVNKKILAMGFLIISFLLSNARILGTLSPFSIALTSALPTGFSYFSFLGGIAGYMAFGGMIDNVVYISAMITIVAVKFWLSTIGKKKLAVFIMPMITAGAMLLTGLIVGITVGITEIELLFLACEVFLAGAMTYFCQVSFDMLLSEVGEKTIKLTDISSVMVVIGIILLSLYSINVGFLSIGRTLAIIISLMLIYSYGVNGGVCGGVIVGICSILYNRDFAIGTGTIIIAAFFAGLAKPLGRLSQIAMFIVVNASLTLITGATEQSINQMFDVFIATTLFTLIPSKRLEKMKFEFGSQPKVKSSANINQMLAAKLSLASETITDLGNSVKKVSRKMDKIAGADITTVYNRVAEETCKYCGLKLFCWEKASSDTLNAFNDITGILRSKGSISIENAPIFLKQKCCRLSEIIDNVNKTYMVFLTKEKTVRRVGESRAITIEQFDGIADMLCEMVNDLGDIAKYDENLAEKARNILQDFDIFPENISCIIDKYGRTGIEIYLKKLPKVDVKILSGKLSDNLNREFDLPSIINTGGATKLAFFEKAIYSVDFFATQLPKGSNKMCGDSYEFFVDAKGYIYLILSDGMGNGNRAAIDSVMTCSLVLKLIKSGFGLEAALKLINASLSVKSDDESLATLDIAKFDLYLGEAEFLKAGAAASFVKRGDSVVRLESKSLPIGIVQNVKFGKSNIKVGNGDVILIVSDGVVETGEEWLEAELELNGNRTAKELSERILREARRRNIRGHTDDMTVMAAKIIKN